MNIYTIGFTKKKASEFFGLISKNKIDLLLDIRLNNKSQLAGFTKGDDLSFFLKYICGCSYIHCIEADPSKELLSDYKKGKISWNNYEKIFFKLMQDRKTIEKISLKYKNYTNICLLCSEEKPDMCHRRLVAELWKKFDGNINIFHI